MTLSAHSETLSHWVRWAVRLRLGEPHREEPAPTGSLRLPSWEGAQRLISAHGLVVHIMSLAPPTWIPASELVHRCVAMSRAEGAQFSQMYTDSKRRLFPLSDPLDVAFPLHRQLSASREEVYSDWLQWVLQQVADVRLISRIIGSPNRERFANWLEPISVEREVRVEHGNIDQSGRLDIVISQGPAKLAVIEVKTRAFGESDLEKHQGYSASITSPETEFIFLSVDSPGSDLSYGFRSLSWGNVCVTLRAIAPRLLGPERILSTALILAFVGAVEQNLLGFESPETPRMSTVNVPRMVDHFARARREEEAFGES